MRGPRWLSIDAIEGSIWLLPALGLVACALQAAGAISQLDGAVAVNVALLLIEGMVFSLSVWFVLRGATVSLGWILGVAVLLRLTLLFLSPYYSSDMYRYVWDGRVQAAGINPYLYIPNDVALESLRDGRIWPNVNRADYAPTIYPPVAQAVFFFVTRFTSGVIGMKVAWVLFEGVTAWGVVGLLDALKLSRARLLIYAWSPLVVLEVAGSGHLDGAMTTFFTLAVLARIRGRNGAAGLALGLAVMVKFFPLVTLPALWRRGDWRLPVVCAAVIVVGYLLYIPGAGPKVLGFMSGYSHEEGLLDGNGFWFLRLLRKTTGFVIPPVTYVAVVAALLGALALAILRARADASRISDHALALAATGMVALSPTHPWYFLWLTPLLCMRPSPPLMWLVVASPLVYVPNPSTVPWNTDALYGGFCLCALATVVFRLTKPFRSREEIR